jgi:hypothetical protein
MPTPPADPLSTATGVIKPGRTQVFTACELFAVSGGEEKLVATGEGAIPSSRRSGSPQATPTARALTPA